MILNSSDILCGSAERRLLRHLFVDNNYSKHERPVEQEADAVNVRFGITLQQIFDVVRNFCQFSYAFCHFLHTHLSLFSYAFCHFLYTHVHELLDVYPS